MTAALSDDNETSRAPSMHTHPSGVDLVDPPEGAPIYFEDAQEQPMTSQRSGRLQLSFSRKSSKKLSSAMQRARQGPLSLLKPSAHTAVPHADDVPYSVVCTRPHATQQCCQEGAHQDAQNQSGFKTHKARSKEGLSVMWSTQKHN